MPSAAEARERHEEQGSRWRIRRKDYCSPSPARNAASARETTAHHRAWPHPALRHAFCGGEIRREIVSNRSDRRYDVLHQCIDHERGQQQALASANEESRRRSPSSGNSRRASALTCLPTSALLEAAGGDSVTLQHAATERPPARLLPLFEQAFGNRVGNASHDVDEPPVTGDGSRADTACSAVAELMKITAVLGLYATGRPAPHRTRRLPTRRTDEPYSASIGISPDGPRGPIIRGAKVQQRCEQLVGCMVCTRLTLPRLLDGVLMPIWQSRAMSLPSASGAPRTAVRSSRNGRPRRRSNSG